MGNCQSAEADTVLIQHPSGRMERIYWSVSASQVMTSNPGHYVAVIVTSNSNSKTTHTSTSCNYNSSASPPVNYLKLLTPQDTLHIGHVYRLVTFQEVLKEFVSKKYVKLSRLLHGDKEKSRSKRSREQGRVADTSPPQPQVGVVEGQLEVEAEVEDQSSSSRISRSGPVPCPRRWRPALQSIAEFGSPS